MTPQDEPLSSPSPAGLPNRPASSVPPVDTPARLAERRMLLGLSVGSLLAVLLLAVLSSVALLGSRAVHRQRAVDATTNLAQGLKQSIAAEIQLADVALQAVAQAHERQSRAGQFEAATFEREIEAWQSLAVGINSLRMTDAQGIVRHGRGVSVRAPVDVSDRAYFQQARDLALPGLIVTGPVFARISQTWALVLARRVNHADGSFAGVVYANLATERFEQLFRSVKLGPSGAASLRTTSLQLVARHSGDMARAQPIGSSKVSDQLREALQRQPEAGSYLAATAIDAVERVNAYGRVGDLPLIVIVGLATEDFLAPWHAEARLVLMLAGFTALTLVGASVLVFRVWRRDRRSQQALIREGDRYRALLVTASDGIHVLNREGRVVDLSDSFATLLGASRQQVLGMHVSEWSVDEPRDRLDRAMREFQLGKPWELSTRFKRMDGRLLDVEVFTFGIRIGEEDLMFCSARDITRRRQSEQALMASQAFLDRTGRIAAVGGWEVDLRTEVATWSEQTCRIHEVPPGFQPTMAQAIEFYAPEARATLRAGIDRALELGTPWDLELPLITATGRRLWVRAFGEVEFDQGKPARIFGAIQDVTELHQRSDELQREHTLRTQSQRHAEELDRLLRERSEMLDVLAHEVRQPLNNASAALQSAATVMAQAGDSAASSRLHRAQAVMGQVLANIDNTLAVASLLGRADPIEREDADIDTLIAVALADLPQEQRPRFEVQRLTSTRTASMDMSLMRLALRNLLTNAIKYSPPGSPVLIRLSDSDEPLALVIEVRDQGPGISAELVPRLFERGARGRHGAGPSGHGLGLYIVRRVMELHGGQAELALNGPQGVTMRLCLVQSDD